MNRIVLLVFLGMSVCASVSAQRPRSRASAIAAYLRQEIAAGTVVGAQVLVKSPRSRVSESFNLGTVAPRDPRPVSDSTLFCIASCSKPVASALVFTLLDERRLRLDQTAGEFWPAMAMPVTIDGGPTRSPTLRELLAHRGGIYSQMQSPNAVQLSAIRDFTHTLDESIAIILDQPLASVPGTEYAYSGAGYCLAGSMAEKATGETFEALLQGRLCNPLQMESTTYFPTSEAFTEIAEGGESNLTPPHSLGSNNKLPLVGGSLYTTTKDMERFVQMVVNQGRSRRTRVLSDRAISFYLSQPYPNQPYGYGWLLTKAGGRVVAVSHNGSLPPYQSAVRIQLMDKAYRIVFWTLANPRDAQSTNRIKGRIASLIR